MTKEAPEKLTDWLGQEWTPDCGRLAAHKNSRFCAPAENCPILDGNWEEPEGVKVDAIFFGGRRPEGIPLISQAFSWEHGVFLGAALRSEATAAAEFTVSLELVFFSCEITLPSVCHEMICHIFFSS